MSIAYWRNQATRFLGMVSGEAMQSAFHFILNVALVHIMSAHEYGVFAIIMVIGGVGITYIRAFSAMPVSIWIGRSHSRHAANAYDVTFGSGAVVLSVLLGAVTSLLLQSWIGCNALLGGAFVALWCIRSYVRAAFFALRLARSVILADGVFTFVGVMLGLLTIHRDASDKLGATLLTLLIANAVSIGVAMLTARRPFRFSLGLEMRRRYARLWRQMGWSAVSVTTSNLQGQSLSLLVATFAGPAAYAPIAAGFVMFVPLRIVGFAIVNMLQPTLAGHVKRGEIDQLWPQVRVWTAVMALGCLAYGFIGIAAFSFLDIEVFHGQPVGLIGLCCWAIYSLPQVYVMPRLLLEAANAFRLLALITAAGAITGSSMMLILLMVASPAWSLVGAFASEAVVLVAFWLAIIKLFPIAAPGGARNKPRETPDLSFSAKA